MKVQKENTKKTTTSHNGEIGGRKEKESVLCEKPKAKKKGKR